MNKFVLPMVVLAVLIAILAGILMVRRAAPGPGPAAAPASVVATDRPDTPPTLPDEPQSTAPAALASVERLAADLGSEDGATRVAASKALLGMGRDALPGLEAAGAKVPQTISARRLDVLAYTLQGLPTSNYFRNSLGLQVEPGVSLEDVAAMGTRHGFTVTSTAINDGAPSCRVKLAPGTRLGPCIAGILSTEPRVISLSLNWFEH